MSLYLLKIFQLRKGSNITNTEYDNQDTWEEENKILTEKLGYPQFYTQMVFEIDSPIIEIKTVIGNEEGIDILSTCKNIERFKNERFEIIFKLSFDKANIFFILSKVYSLILSIFLSA